MGTLTPSAVDFSTSSVTSRMSTEASSNRTETNQTILSQTVLSTTAMDNGTASFTDTQNITCVPEQNLYTISFQSFILPTLIFNILLFTAAILDRKKLTRQNYLFASVISTLLSNILYIIVLEWILIDNYFEVPVKDSVAGTYSSAKYVWVLEESVNVAMPFLICGNIVCLTYVTVNSATYVGRVANIEDVEQSERRSLQVRRITRALIGTSWAVPAFLTILGMTTMNCVLDCICPSTNFKGNLCPNQTGCSTFWAPVTEAYIWVNVGLWSAAIVGLLLLIGFSIAEFERTTKSTKPAQPTTNQENNAESTNNTEIHMSQSRENSQKTNLKRKRSTRSLKRKLNSRLRFALVLTVIYVTSSACFMAAVAMDSVMPETSDILVFGLSRITMYLYTAACPFVMIWHLPALKTSFEKLCHRIKKLCS